MFKYRFYFTFHLAISVILFNALFLGVIGCGAPTFPKDNVIESVKKICKEEYKVEIESKIAGKNIGTYVVLNDIFDKEQGLSKEASEHLGDILLSVSRVCLSTDAPLEFYTVIAADKSLPGVEAVFVRYVDDVKRYILGNISREDFFQRLTIDVRFNPASLAQRKVYDFFSNLSKGNTRSLLANYMQRNSDSNEFSSPFLRMILEMKLKENVHFEIIKLLIKPLPKEKSLVYCRAKETYNIRQGNNFEDFTFPTGFIHEYLFLIGTSNYSPEIQEIIPLDYKDEKGVFKKRSFPSEYKDFNNIRKWNKQDFLLENLTLPDFIASQIAQRIIRKIREMETLEEGRKKDGEKKKTIDFKIETVRGRFVSEEGKENKKNSSFQLDFKVSFNFSDKVIPEEIYKVTVEIAKDVIGKYRFQDFKEIRLQSNVSSEIQIIPKSEVF